MSKLLITIALLLTTPLLAQDYIIVSEADGGGQTPLSVQALSIAGMDDVKLYPASIQDSMRNARQECSCITNIPGLVKDYTISSLTACYDLDERMFEYKAGNRVTAKATLLKCGPIEKGSGYRAPIIGGSDNSEIITYVDRLRRSISNLSNQVAALKAANEPFVDTSHKPIAPVTKRTMPVYVPYPNYPQPRNTYNDQTRLPQGYPNHKKRPMPGMNH